MAQIYDPNQAGAFNKALQSGLSTADAATQAGITATKDFALGTNGNLGGLIPGANAAPATGQATFQSVDFAQTFSGQPAQGTQLSMNAQQVQEFRATPGNEGIPFVQNPVGPPGDLIPRIDVNGAQTPPTTAANGPLQPLQTTEIQPRPVTGLDLTAPSPTPSSATDPRVTVYGPPPIASTATPNVPTVEATGTGSVTPADAGYQFSPTDPRVSSSIPNPVIVTTSDAARDAAISASRPGYDQAPPVTDTNIAGGIRAQDVGPSNYAPAPQQVPTQTVDPQQAAAIAAAAPTPPDQSAAETARLAAAGNADPNNYVETFAPPPVDEFAGIDQQVAANQRAAALENQSDAETARLNNANQQAAIQSTYKQPGNVEWRFRISLAEGADYLYKASGGAGSPSASSGFSGAQFGNTGAGPGILAPLAGTNGVVFPYTPQVQMSYRAKYNAYELVHSNYRGAFYQNSSVDDISIRGTFTAQDTKEAAYMLAVIHFFRSVTKMFYGQDAQRGAPPPLVYLSGLGDYQFNNHPAVVTSFDYSLPADVDYIRANYPNNFGTDLLSRRPSYAAPPSNPLSAIANRLAKAFLSPGAEPQVPGLQPITNSVTNTATATYVPTKIEISLNLMPMQTRDQVSKQFSLAKFATGQLISGGFW
jgi:hypothetical protein